MLGLNESRNTVLGIFQFPAKEKTHSKVSVCIFCYFTITGGHKNNLVLRIYSSVTICSHFQVHLFFLGVINILRPRKLQLFNFFKLKVKKPDNHSLQVH